MKLYFTAMELLVWGALASWSYLKEQPILYFLLPIAIGLGLLGDSFCYGT